MDSLVPVGSHFGATGLVNPVHSETPSVRVVVHNLLVGFAGVELCVARVCVLAHGRFQLG